MKYLLDIKHYQKALDNDKLPTFRGMKLSEDDRIRQHATQQLRSYFKIDFNSSRDVSVSLIC